MVNPNLLDRRERGQKLGKNVAARHNWRDVRQSEGRAQRLSGMDRGRRAVISRLAYAVLRAVLVVILVSIPSLLIPGVTQDTAEVVALVALFGAILTVVEYTSAYPGLVEFRDAPPFNRIRFASLFAMVLILAIILRGEYSQSSLSMFMQAVGALIGQVIDFPYSPVRLVVLMLPDDTSAAQIDRVRTAAGMAYLISLVTLAIFLIVPQAPELALGRRELQRLGEPADDLRPHGGRGTWWSGSSATRALTSR